MSVWGLVGRLASVVFTFAIAMYALSLAVIWHEYDRGAFWMTVVIAIVVMGRDREAGA